MSNQLTVKQVDFNGDQLTAIKMNDQIYAVVIFS